MTELLTASFGHDSWSGVWISLQTNHQLDEELFAAVLQSYGCHPGEMTDKIISVMRTAGRYDCCVQRTWINHRYEQFVAEMRMAGVTIVTDAYYMPVKVSASPSR